MKDVYEQAAGKPSSISLDLIARQQRYIIVALLFCSLLVGVLIGAVITRGALADPDNRVAISSRSAVPDALSASFVHAAEIVEPAVVHIDVQEKDVRGQGREAKGSGVIVTPTGYILTNYHVIEDASRIRVRLADHREFDATVAGSDEDTDLAVLKIEAPSNLPFANFGDSNSLRVGDWVLAVGSPFGLEQTVTAGIISAKERDSRNGASSAFQQFLQTDAAINPGNSGGPLVNLAGEVVGINTQIATRTGAFSGIGFALPSSTAIDIYNALVENGRVDRGFLGIRPAPVTPEIARMNGLSSTDGVLIDGLSAIDGPAANAGLKAGDVITEINGEPVRDDRELIRRVGAMPAGTVIRVTYIRDGVPNSVTVKLADRAESIARSRTRPDSPFPYDDEEGGELPEGHPAIPRSTGPPTPIQLGLTIRTLTKDLARDRSLDSLSGVLVLGVNANSIASDQGVQPNDVIMMINRQRIGGESEFSAALARLRSGDEIKLLIARRVGARIERRYATLVVP